MEQVLHPTGLKLATFDSEATVSIDAVDASTDASAANRDNTLEFYRMTNKSLSSSMRKEIERVHFRYEPVFYCAQDERPISLLDSRSQHRINMGQATHIR